MNRLFLVILISLAGIKVCYPQPPAGFPVIDKTNLPEAKFSPSRTFSGTSLFGYIDGGAELYLEFGFSGAVVTEISTGDGKFKTEIFKMTGPEEAFGIFSVSKYRCLSMPVLAKYSCQTKYQLQFCRGQFYISIINSTGTSSDSVTMALMGKIISGKIDEPDFDVTGYLPGISSEYNLQKTILAKGRLGIINGSPGLEDFFRGASEYTTVVAAGSGKTIISARFNNNGQFKKFLELHRWDNLDLTLNESRQVSGGNIRQIAENHLLIEVTE